MHINCLIVDDETDLAKMTCEYFEMFDVSCTYAETAESCLLFLQENTVDLLLLDINLKEESGFYLCKKIREDSDIPILFISARQSDGDILTALNIGGDDYIKKPYSLNILLAKVKAVLKRIEKQRTASERQKMPMQAETPETGKDVREPAQQGASVRAANTENAVYGDDGEEILRLEEELLRAFYHGKEVSLKYKEFKLLKCLFERRDTIVTKETLFDTVWGDRFFSDGTLNVHIRRLREKLEENPNEPKLIQTVWGTGYLLKTK